MWFWRPWLQDWELWPTTRQPPPSIFVMAITGCWRCRGMKMRFAMPPIGCWRTQKVYAVCASMPVNTQAAKAGQRLSSNSSISYVGCAGRVLTFQRNLTCAEQSVNDQTHGEPATGHSSFARYLNREPTVA